MSIDSWANDQELIGAYVTFDDKGKLKIVFLSDGTVIDTSNGKAVEFDVEKEGKQWKFTNSSKRLLNKLKALATTNGGTLVGLNLEIAKIGEKFSTDYVINKL